MADSFAKFCAWSFAHCLKKIDGKICKDWSCDYCSDKCKGVPFDKRRPQCTRFMEEEKKGE